jgi:hypothetical protein
MVSSETLRRVALVRTDVPEELSASFIRVTRIGELGTTLAVTNNIHKLSMVISKHIINFPKMLSQRRYNIEVSSTTVKFIHFP